MKNSLLAGLLLLGFCLMHLQPLAAQGAPSPFAFAKQYSADMVITSSDGNVLTNKIYMDDGKVRTDMSMHGMAMVLIARPDQQKVYRILVDQKMVMETPYDAAKYKKLMGPAGPDARFELIGPDTLQGVACTKYKVTSGDGKVSNLWVDASTKAPVMMMAEDNSVTIQWKNYKTGPQDASLFEPPADYQKVAMPTMPAGAPGGAPGAGPGAPGQ